MNNSSFVLFFRRTELNLITFCTLILLIVTPYVVYTAQWKFSMTPAEKAEVGKLIERRIINDSNINEFLERIRRAPSHKDRVQQALDRGFGATAHRELADIVRAFKDPRLPWETFKKEIAERGILPVVVGTIWSAVTSPIRAIEEVFGGEPGLGEYPLKMLVGCVIFFG